MDFGVIIGHIFLNRYDEVEFACVEMFVRKHWFLKSNDQLLFEKEMLPRLLSAWRCGVEDLLHFSHLLYHLPRCICIAGHFVF